MPDHDEKIAVRVAVLERDCEDFRQVIVEIRNSLQAVTENLQAIVRLEEKHNETSRAINRSFVALENVEKRVSVIEQKMPGLLEMRTLIVGAICVVLTGVGGAILAAIGIKQ